MPRRKRRNKVSVHPVLRSTYGNRARRLKDAILSLLPPPPDRCQCGGIGCLRCRAADHLVCHGDPTTYRHLISYAQCAIASDAPDPPVAYSVRRLSQRQIVRNTMEVMKRTRSSKDNLLCKSYDMHSRTSLSVELLSSADWSLLLDRIGDMLMEYLLRHYTIFVPNGRSIKGFIQVTGAPLTSFYILKPSHSTSAPAPVLLPQQAGCTPTLSHKCQRVGQVGSRAHLKRKMVELAKESSVSKPCKRKRLHSWQRRKQRNMDCQNRARSEHLTGKDSKACFRCYMLHSTRNLPVDVPIKRQCAFYNGWSSQALFHRRHILNLLKPNDSGAFSLMENIFGNDKDVDFLQCTLCGNSARSRSKCLYHSSLAWFKSLIRDAQRCRHRMLLQKHCYVSSFNKDGHLGPKNQDSKSIASPFSPHSFSKHHQVVSFIFAALRRIVPPPLLGNKKSWRVLRINIYKFVRLRRHEKFFLQEILEGLEVSNFEFLSNLEKSCCCDGGGKKTVPIKKLLSTWVYWLFSHVIVPIISSNFYATEKESKRYEVFYYKKPIWRSTVKDCIEKLKMKNFCPVNPDLLRNIFNDRRCFGFSKFRFLPKENCLRPLASLNKPSTLKFLNNKRFQSVNSLLNELHVILKTIKVQYPNLLGSSVSDYNDVYQKLHGFISKVKNDAATMPDIFIVVADVSKAFDSIDQEKILKIMEGVIQNGEYTVGNYRRVLSRNNCLCPVFKVPSLGSISWRNEGSCAPTPVVQFSSNCGFFVAQAAHRKKKKDYLNRLLSEHVKHNIVKIGRDFYEQKVGIAQGSILSSILCSFYMGHLEENLIHPYLQKLEDTGNQSPQYLLMRYLDDFIFVSTSEKQAIGFLERLRRGFRDYNCYMNCTKFGLNFEVETGEFTNRRYVGDDGVPFLPWSGLLVNCITLEIQADYTRYGDIDMRSTITVHRSNKPGDLRSKLFSYMLPKSYVILYDSSINSPAIVRLNAYQAFLLCAMKFHCYICEMHDSVLSADQLLKIIEKTCRYMYNLICKRVRDAETCFGICPVLRLMMKEIFWLGLFAFIRILKKKQARHKDLLLLLREKINKYGMWAHASYHLRYAVDDSHSSMFWKIKY